MPEEPSNNDSPPTTEGGGGKPPTGRGGGVPTAPAPRAGPQASVLSLAQLIGAPIHALVDAEAQSAMATARFIRLVGFTGDGDGMGELGDLQMARFRRRRRNTDGKDEDVEVEIPLLSMLPIPALQIRDAELEYTVRIIQTEAIQSQGDTEQSMMVKTPDGEPVATLRASFARDPRSDGRRSTDMLVKMKLRIEQADMPAGLAQLLALASESSGQVVLPPADDEPSN